MIHIALSEKMREAIELLKKEEFFFVKINVQYGKHIIFLRQYTLRQCKHLKKRGVVEIDAVLFGNADRVAKLVILEYEELTASEYCMQCTHSYESSLGRYRCRRTGEIVVGKDGRATVNAMKCR